MSAAGVPHLPVPDGSDGIPPADIYRLAVEEYRFQAEFNWSRTRYLLAFNAAILAAGSALSIRAAAFAIPVFMLGVIASYLAARVTRVQHTYYRAARDRMREIEEAQNLQAPYRIDTTATLGGRPRLRSVQDLVYLLLGAIALANLVGVGFVITVSIAGAP